MKRLHVHVSVADLPASVRFYSALFAAEPVVIQADYAKWMLDDPRVNFAISQRGVEQPGWESTTSESRSTRTANCRRCARGWPAPNFRFRHRPAPVAATPGRTSTGPSIRPASHGSRTGR